MPRFGQRLKLTLSILFKKGCFAGKHNLMKQILSKTDLNVRAIIEFEVNLIEADLFVLGAEIEVDTIFLRKIL